MQYICLFCEAIGASSDRNTGPATFNCHVCGENHGMWPRELAQKHLHVVSVLRRQGSDVTDRLMIAKLQRDLNSAKEKLRDQGSRFQFEKDQLTHTLAIGREFIEKAAGTFGNVSDQTCAAEFLRRTAPKPVSK